MNIAKAFSAPVIRFVEGKEVQFPRLSVAEVAAIAASLKAKNIERVKKFCEEAEVKGLDKFRALHQADNEEPTINSVWIYATSLLGSSDIVRQSLKKRNATDAEMDQIINDVGPEELLYLAQEVTGCPFEEVPPPADDKKEAKKKK